jgi:hypothetical protein
VFIPTAFFLLAALPLLQAAGAKTNSPKNKQPAQ